MIETAIVPFPERFLSNLYSGESKSFEQLRAQSSEQCAPPEARVASPVCRVTLPIETGYYPD